MSLRPPVPGDAPAVLGVLVARDLADLGAPDYTLEDLADEWRASDLDLASDARVIESGGRIVAYAVVRRSGASVVVAPEFEGQGIGTQLLRWAEGREREQGRDRHRQWIAGSNERGRELLTAAGYERTRSHWRMVRRFDEPPSGGKPPAGVRLRSLDVEGDALALHALDAASFGAAPYYRPESVAEFCEEHLGAHDLDPTLSCVAVRHETIVGFLLARRWKDEAIGYVDILAVHPDEQRRGLGTALLQAAFVGFADIGLREAHLGVASDNPRALGLYERAGMAPRFRFDTYDRPIPHLEAGNTSSHTRRPPESK